ncbi:MAG: hypothetical protein RL523_859 [Actinomycetota bacterium]|jgi:hypothetical protein
MFGRKKKLTDIFQDLPKAPVSVESQPREIRKSGKRAMLIPEGPYTDNPAADLLLANTGKQREIWLDIIFASQLRESKQAQIAKFLQDDYRVQKWWANSIALMYLKWRAQSKSSAADERLLRITSVIPTTSALAYNIFTASTIYGEGFNRFLKLVQDEKIIIGFTNQTRATLIFESASGNCNLLVEHEFLDDTAKRREATKYWQNLIQNIIDQVSR